MKNREKYADDIINATIIGGCAPTRSIAGISCAQFDMDCARCAREYSAWLEAEYVEPPVDWSKVEVDAPILVSMDGNEWEKRHFASYVDGVVKAWDDGRTSYTEKEVCQWPYAKLAAEIMEMAEKWDL